MSVAMTFSNQMALSRTAGAGRRTPSPCVVLQMLKLNVLSCNSALRRRMCAAAYSVAPVDLLLAFFG